MADSDPFPSLESVYRLKGSKVSNLAGRVKGKSVEAGGSKWQVKSPNTKSSSFSGKGALNDSNLSPEPVIHAKPNNRSSSSFRIDTKSSKASMDEKLPGPHYIVDNESNEDEPVDCDPDILFDSDDDFSLDDSDIVDIEKSHESRKKITWFRAFFNVFDRLSNDEINKQKWHCPACQGGAGAIKWYKGMQPLMNHARTITSRRAKLHHLFAKTLEEELSRRRASITVASGAYGRWKGLEKQEDDSDIVWPPMVLIMNTSYEEDGKWIGMGNQELLDLFSSYAALKAQHSHGPQGHQGMSVLIFESSAFGYFKALRLHDHFIEHGRDRKAWNDPHAPLVQGGKRLLYGFLASGKDIDFFNRRSIGNSRLKFEMRSYKEMVYKKMKNNNDREQLDYLSNKMAKEQMKLQCVAKSLPNVSEKLCWATEESNVEQQRTKIQSCEESSKKQEVKHRLQDKETRQFKAERDSIIKIGKGKKSSLKKKMHQQEEVKRSLELKISSS